MAKRKPNDVKLTPPPVPAPAAAEPEAPPPALTETDRARFEVRLLRRRLADEQVARLKAEMAQAQAAQAEAHGKYNALVADLAKRYALAEGDRVVDTTGEILRVGAAE